METTRETAERLISELQQLAASVEQLEAERAQLLQLLEDSRRRFRILEQVHERLRLLETRVANLTRSSGRSRRAR